MSLVVETVYNDTVVGNHGCASGIHCNVLRSKLGSSSMDDGATLLKSSHTSARLRRYCEPGVRPLPNDDGQRGRGSPVDDLQTSARSTLVAG